ncbi:MAG: ATP-binding protein, partial [Desulfotomaculales bacterium]
MFKKAVRKDSRIRLALIGPSGSGKTYSALLIARGLVGPQGRIAVIDTEHGSASLYADITPFDVCELSPPFNPEKYIEAIKTAEKLGYHAVIIDSLSHAWMGTGGILDIHNAATAKEKNSWAAWRLVTPRHNDLVEAMLQSPCHIIATIRAKQEYVPVEEGGKTKIQKVGLAPVQRDGLEYEFTLVFDLDASHNAIASKDRTSLFDGQVIRLSPATGMKLREWLEGA